MKTITTIIFFFITLYCFGINTQYKISNHGKELIKLHENCSLIAYEDANGYSIGYGHHTKDIYRGMKISQKQAEKYFNEDIIMVEQSVNRLISQLPYRYKFSQGFIDGLCSLVYNCGEEGIRSSTFYQKLKSCRVRNGKMNISDLNYTISFVKNTRISCKGHIARRQSEMKIMLV